MCKLGQFWEQPRMQTQQEKNPCVKSQRCQLPKGAKNGKSEDVSDVENAQNMGFSFLFFADNYKNKGKGIKCAKQASLEKLQIWSMKMGQKWPTPLFVCVVLWLKMDQTN